MRQTWEVSDRAVSLIRGPAASAKASPVPAEMQHSPQHGGSARPAAESASGQKQEGSAGSRRFTPAQQAVATALMVVMKRALTDGREAALAAMLILGSNNPFTRRFLMMLSNSSPPPTMKEIEQRATDQLLEHLTELATQCARVQCQPLEVFTRSMQCAARVTHRDLFEELGERGPLDWELWKMPRSMPYYSPDALERLQRDGMPRVLAHLWLTFTEALNVYNLDPKTAVLAAPDLNHMLPGRLQHSVDHLNLGFQLKACLSLDIEITAHGLSYHWDWLSTVLAQDSCIPHSVWHSCTVMCICGTILMIPWYAQPRAYARRCSSLSAALLLCSAEIIYRIRLICRPRQHASRGGYHWDSPVAKASDRLDNCPEDLPHPG